jgi:hypothetical protein
LKLETRNFAWLLLPPYQANEVKGKPAARLDREQTVE